MRRSVPLQVSVLALGALFVLVSSLSGTASAQEGGAQEQDSASAWDPAAAERNLRGRIQLDPGDPEGHALLGELLAGQSRFDGAVVHYRKALALDGQNRRARVGLARTLAWAGNSDEASRRFDDLLADDPDDLEALFGRGQIGRWQGERSRARALLRRASALDPSDPRFPVELGWLELGAGRLQAATELAEEARRLGGSSEELTRAIETALAPTIRTKMSFSDESQSFRRASTTTRFEFSPLADSRVRVAPGFDYFDDKTGDIERYSLGVHIRHVLPHDFQAVGSYFYRNASSAAATHAFQGELRGRPFDAPLDLWIGGSRRAIVDDPPGYEDVAHLEGIGSGGSTLEAIRKRRQTSEVYAGLSTSPLPGSYAYASFTAGWISDDNESRSATAGVGIDLFQLLPGPKNQHLTLKYDFFYRDVDDEVPEYWSPSNFDVHTPSIDWRWHPKTSLVLGLEAGIPLKSGEAPGWMAGGFAAFELTERLQVEARARHTEDTAFRVTGGTLGARWRF